MGSRLTALAVALLVLAGCSDGDGDDAAGTSAGGAPDKATASTDGPAPTVGDEGPVEPVQPPEDTLTVAAEGIVCAVPQTWEMDGPTDDDGIVQVSARGRLPGDLPATVQVVSVETSRSTAERWTEEARTIGEVTDEWTFTLPTLSTNGPITLLDVENTGEEVRGWLLIFEHADGRTYNVTLTSPADDFDERHAAVILGTVRDA
ncbi:hypothetical protein [uncultured Ornithinimicrobium sp.]|uniref:hypothetical protein n=1 Tax=uncultured Ornithinimicrobium sp. TaxID=259307 RepID=UPI002599423E|nr:hypothetical protein [uncultured Ornithinimicrobium sp.]